jgi:DNA processing protein
MSAVTQGAGGPGACSACLRHSWLLAVLSARLDHRGRDEGRLLELLALSDEELVEAVGGRRRAELEARYARFALEQVQWIAGVEGVCRHDPRYPHPLRSDGAPRMLHVAGGLERLEELAAAPVVAIVGSRRATDYGMEMAKSIARGLAVSGVTVASGLADGIAVAAQAGAVSVDGRTLAVMGGGLDVACPASRRTLYEHVQRSGCALAELPCGCSGRRWGGVSSGRILAALAGVTVVVEAEESRGELAGASLAQALGKTVAAVPGRVTSPASCGTHALLIDGAHLVRGPGDVLELLCPTVAPRPAACKEASSALEPRLRAVLESVGAGRDTPDKLTSEGDDAGEVLLALSELELMGLLARGDGGRYVPRDALQVA